VSISFDKFQFERWKYIKRNRSYGRNWKRFRLVHIICANTNLYHVWHMIKVMDLGNNFIIIANSEMKERRKSSSNYHFCCIIACYRGHQTHLADSWFLTHIPHYLKWERHIFFKTRQILDGFNTFYSTLIHNWNVSCTIRWGPCTAWPS
jgi:hypothetical protein